MKKMKNDYVQKSYSYNSESKSKTMKKSGKKVTSDFGDAGIPKTPMSKKMKGKYYEIGSNHQ